MTVPKREHHSTAALMADVGALVLDSIEDGIAVLQPCDGAMLLAAVNRGFEKLLGYAAAEVVGWPIEHVFGDALSQGSRFDRAASRRALTGSNVR